MTNKSNLVPLQLLEVDLEPFKALTKVFLAMNQRLNLIAHSQENCFETRHLSDCLAMKLIVKELNLDLSAKIMLDLGTGGGLPALPLAIFYPKLKIIALDSIHKKIAAVNAMIKTLKLTNINAVCARAESLIQQFDIVTSRAVASLVKLVPLVAPRLKRGGIFVAYKGLKVEEEIAEALKILKQFNLQLVAKISYTLKVPDAPTRFILGFKKV